MPYMVSSPGGGEQGGREGGGSGEGGGRRGGLGIMFPLRGPEHRQPKYRGSKKAKFMPTNPGLERELGL
jgi:hypothetical protein